MNKKQKTIKLKRLAFPKKIRAVLFDYDGVIADTMEDNFVAWRTAFAKSGQKIKRTDYFPLEGLNPQRIASVICHKYSLRTKQKDIIREKENYYRNNNHFRIYPGVENVLAYLKDKKVNLALVSGSSSERLNFITPAKILSYFKVIITGDMVKRPKPSPEPYLKAIHLIKCSRQNSLIIENSPLGIESAFKSKIFCIALKTTIPKNLLKADLVIDNIIDIKNELEINDFNKRSEDSN